MVWGRWVRECDHSLVTDRTGFTLARLGMCVVGTQCPFSAHTWGVVGGDTVARQFDVVMRKVAVTSILKIVMT